MLTEQEKNQIRQKLQQEKQSTQAPADDRQQKLQMIRERKAAMQQRNSVMPTAASEQPKDGFFNSLAKDIVRPFARLGVNVAKAAQIVTPGGGKVDTAAPVNIPWLGPTKAVGQEGSFGQRLKDSFGTGLEAASTVVPTPVGIAGVAKAGLKGKILKGIGTGVKSGAVSGTLYGAGREMQNADSTFGSVAKEAVTGGAIGAVVGGVIGGASSTVGAGVRGTTKLVTQKGRQEIAENTMGRVARINPTDYNKFKNTTGKDTGAYLVERGIYGNDEEIVQKLTDDWMRSKDIVDTEFAKMGGTWRHAPVKDALEMLAEREAKVSTPNVKSPDFDRVQSLLRKYNTEGLTMQEVNDVKRLLERNVKLDYLKPNSMNPEKVTQATNVDNDIREWQISTADKMGLQNLKELNKNTQASRMLADSLYKKITGQSGNNAISLGDLVLLSGGDVRNVAMAGARKFFGSKSVQSKFAQAISPVKGTQVMPQKRGAITAPERLLPDASFMPMGAPKAAPDGSFVRAVPAKYAPITAPGRLLESGAPVSKYNQGRAIPVFPRPIQGDYVGNQTIVGRSTPIPQQISRTLGQQGMPLPTVKQGTPTPSTPLSTATRQSVSSTKSTTRKVWDSITGKNIPNKQGGMINPGAIADDLMGKGDDALMAEARKYKSVEEFVNSVDDNFYTRRVYDWEIKHFEENGKLPLSTDGLVPSKKVIEPGQSKNIKGLGSLNTSDKIMVFKPSIRKLFNEYGKGEKFSLVTEEIPQSEVYGIFNKSQLIDIYNRAHGKQASTMDRIKKALGSDIPNKEGGSTAIYSKLFGKLGQPKSSPALIAELKRKQQELYTQSIRPGTSQAVRNKLVQQQGVIGKQIQALQEKK